MELFQIKEVETLVFEGLTLEELIEIKDSLNTMLGARIQYKAIETNERRLETNESKLELDYKILKKVLEEIETRKGE